MNYSLEIKKGVPIFIDYSSLVQYGLEVVDGILRIADQTKLKQYLDDAGKLGNFIVKSQNGNSVSINLSIPDEEHKEIILGLFKRTILKIKEKGKDIIGAFKFSSKFNIDVFRLLIVYRNRVILFEQRNIGQQIISTSSSEIDTWFNTEKNRLQNHNRLKRKHTKRLYDLDKKFEEEVAGSIGQLFGGDNTHVKVLFENTDHSNNILRSFKDLYPESTPYIVENKHSLVLTDSNEYVRSEMGFEHIIVTLFLRLLFTSIHKNKPDVNLTKYQAKFGDIVSYITKNCSNFDEVTKSLIGKYKFSFDSLLNRGYKDFQLKFTGNKTDEEYQIIRELKKLLSTINPKKCGYGVPRITSKIGSSSKSIFLSIKKRAKTYPGGDHPGVKEVIRDQFQEIVTSMVKPDQQVHILSAFVDNTEDEDNYHLFKDFDNVKFIKTFKRIPYFFKQDFTDLYNLEPERELEFSESASEMDTAAETSASDVEGNINLPDGEVVESEVDQDHEDNTPTETISIEETTETASASTSDTV